MDASQTSDFILNMIKKSNLNFSLSESPFSVSVNIKKTFIKERDGSLRSSGIDENFSPQHLQKVQQHPDVNMNYLAPNIKDLVHPQSQDPVLPCHHQQHDQELPLQFTNQPLFSNANEQPLPQSHDSHLLAIDPLYQGSHDPTLFYPALHHTQLTTPNQIQSQQVYVHIPNIPVHNQFSCLANTLDEDFVKSNIPLENSAKNHYREHNNNNENNEPVSEEELRGCVVDGDELEYLVVNNKRLKEATKRLNKELSRVRTKLWDDKSDAIKDLKGEIKQWRKSLGQERSEKIKLEKKVVLLKSSLEASPSSKPENYESEKVLEHVTDVAEEVTEEETDETCSICTRPIPNYIPKYSCGLLWNPACSDCDDNDTSNDEENG